jgi:hypothetical protein
MQIENHIFNLHEWQDFLVKYMFYYCTNPEPL